MITDSPHVFEYIILIMGDLAFYECIDKNIQSPPCCIQSGLFPYFLND